MSNRLSCPEVEEVDGITVVRDDLTPGGSKTRVFIALMEGSEKSEFVYAGPAFGAAQEALAIAAYRAGKQATVFVAKRRERHARTCAAAAYGARIVEVAPGYLNVVSSRAAAYCEERGAHLVPFGAAVPEARQIGMAATRLGIAPRSIWCAGGSGTLARSLRQAWPYARLNVVQVGRPLDLPENDLMRVHQVAYRFDQRARSMPPFQSDPHYEAKAWEVMQTAENNREGLLFWNVA